MRFSVLCDDLGERIVEADGLAEALAAVQRAAMRIILKRLAINGPLHPGLWETFFSEAWNHPGWTVIELDE